MAIDASIDLVQRHDVALGTLPDNRERGIFHAGDTSPFPAFTVPFGRHTNASTKLSRRAEPRQAGAPRPCEAFMTSLAP